MAVCRYMWVYMAAYVLMWQHLVSGFVLFLNKTWKSFFYKLKCVTLQPFEEYEECTLVYENLTVLIGYESSNKNTLYK